MENNLMQNLNEEQLGAVLHREGPLLIVAGAGTGKTTVITQKIAYMIEQGLAGTEEILALTFTEKAAGEMDERVGSLLPVGYFDLWISTFHSFAEKILKEHGLEIGLPSDFKLLNEFEQWILVNKNLDRFDLNYYRPLGNPTKFIQVMIKHFSRAKDEDISPDDYLKYASKLKADFDNLFDQKNKKSKKLKISEEELIIAEQEKERIAEIANAYRVYQKLLLENSALDFGDLIIYVLKLFRERPAILKKYQDQFKYVLVDEFQDTNWAQYEIVKMIAGKRNNIIVVGDDDQSIYRFRGASMSNILQFKKDYPKAREVILNNNYRNKQNILDLAYEFIKLNNPNRLECHLGNKKTKNSFNKKLKANREGDGVIEIIKEESLLDEVQAVIKKIADLKIADKEAKWSDFAILIRANSSADDFSSVLEAVGLPYQFLSSRGLYTKSVIMDTVAYFKLLDDYHESRAMYRILNIPIFDFSYQEIIDFNHQAKKKSLSLFEVLKNASSFNFEDKILKKIDRVLSLINSHSSLARVKPASEVFVAFLNDSGYLKYIVDQDERTSEEQMDYLNRFMKRIKEFEAGSDDLSVKAFLEEFNMEVDSGEEGALGVDLDSGPDTIKIMTVHSAKGLEFKYVFIVNLVDRRFPTTERKEQIIMPDKLVKEILPEGDIHLEEERRLFYVAITRARDHIYFSYASDYGGVRKKKPSRFLSEIGLVKSDVKKLSSKEIAATKKEALLKKKEIKKDNKIAPHLPSHFSYTQLAAFSNCPYQYRFAHILKVPVQGKGAFSFGKTMHATLQKVFALVMKKRGMSSVDSFPSDNKKLKTVKISLEEIFNIYEESWVDDWYESKKDKENYKEKGRVILKDFYEKYKNNWPYTFMLEKGFNMKIGEGDNAFIIKGAIDRIDAVDGKIKIVDYKTGSPKEKLEFKDKEQLLIYQLAVRDLFKQEVGALSFYYLDDNSEVEFLGRDEDLEKVREKIIDTVVNIKKGDFLPSPSMLCRWCDFFDICEFRQTKR